MIETLRSDIKMLIGEVAGLRAENKEYIRYITRHQADIQALYEKTNTLERLIYSGLASARTFRWTIALLTTVISLFYTIRHWG